MASYYVPILVLFIVLFIVLKKKKLIIAEKVIKRRKTEEIRSMIEFAKRFIGKDCLLYTFDGHQFDGMLLEVSDHAVLLEKNGSNEAINLDFIARIREYPKDKKGKRKSVVID